MGTRSLTKINDSYGNTLVCIYRQHDGHLNGHGAELKTSFGHLSDLNFLGGTSLGCLAAQVVANLKTGPKEIYLYPIDSENEQFTYTLSGSPDKGHLLVKVEHGSEVVYEGPLRDLPVDLDESLLSPDQIEKLFKYLR